MQQSPPAEDPGRKRILFVDDEPRVLAALHVSLRRDCERWDLVFVTGGEAALDELRRGTFDMIVTDLRMPGVDGSELLGYAQRVSPHTIRLLLTGTELDADCASEAIEQVLPKPCRAATLRSTIERWLDRPRHALTR